MSSHGLSSACVIVPVSSYISHVGFRPTNMTSFHKGQITTLKALSPNSPILTSWASGLQQMNLRGDKIQLLIVRMTLYFDFPLIPVVSV